MSTTPPPPGDGYGQPDYGQQPSYGQPAYGEQPSGYPTDPYGSGQPGRPTEMPSSVATAVKLLWASVALSVLSTLLTFTMLDSIVDMAIEGAGGSADTPSTDVIRAGAIMGAIIGLVIGVAITVVLLTFIKKGANWARITWTVLAVLSLLFGLFGIAGQPTLLLVLSLVSIVLTAAILFFLWKKESNPWFKPAAH